MEKNKTIVLIVAFIVLLLVVRRCNNNDQVIDGRGNNQEQVYQKSPVDELIRDLTAEQNFSIILYDMDFREGEEKYYHQYNVLIEKPDTVLADLGDWKEVSPMFFNQHVENMGMEIATKKDGKISKTAAPAGYTNYIGNEKYGQWERRSDGSSFWSFYGRYAFMSSMFHMMAYPVRRSYWNDYHSNYYGHNRPYYGTSSNGGRMYGTSSDYTKSNNKSKWNKQSSSFKNKVRSKVKPSSSTSRRNKSFTKKRTTSKRNFTKRRTRTRSRGFRRRR